jgi:hypothetical protein
MTTVTRLVSSPAYDLGRPAALWLAALVPQQATYKSPGYRAQAAARFNVAGDRPPCRICTLSLPERTRQGWNRFA